MKLAYVILGLALAGTWMSAGVASAADVTGDWDFEVDLADQKGTPSFTFKQEGDKLTGKYKGQFGEADITGKVEGDKIEFTFSPQEEMKVVYKGTIENDTMKGDVDYAGMASGKWTGKKKK